MTSSAISGEPAFGRVPRLIEIILGLRPASVLVVVTHPCFREESYSSFKTQFKNEDYLQNGASFGVEVVDRDKAIQFVDYHWNLSTMLKQSREVGFRMLALAELPDAARRQSARRARGVL